MLPLPVEQAAAIGAGLLGLSQRAADLSRKPLEERSPDEAREIEQKADEIEQQAKALKIAARAKRLGVETCEVR